MPKALAVNWKCLRALYAAGHTAKQISEEKGVSFAALRQRIRREGWDNDVTRVEQAVSHAVTRSLAEAATHWVGEIDQFVSDSLASIKRRDKDSLELRDLKTLLETADLADRMARRNYGLDRDGGRPAVTVNVAMLRGVANSAARPDLVIDVEDVEAPVCVGSEAT